MGLKTFKYIATDKTNQQIVGTYKAEDREQVAEYLQSRELFVVSISEDVAARLKKITEFQIGGIPLKDKMLITKQLATMLRSGLPVLQALDILSKQLETKTLQDQILQVKSDVEGGTPLSTAFDKNTEVFNEVQINLMAAGEESGNMVEVITRIGEDLEKAQKLQSKIKGAMIYPVIIFIAIIVVMIILITFMVPTVEALYADFNAEDQIPGITRFLISLSNFFSNPIGLIIIVLVVIVSIATFRSFKNTEKGKITVARMALKFPVFGTIVEKMQLAQFGRLLAMLLKSGVSILDALKIVSKSMSNQIFADAILKSSEEVSKGVPLAVPLAKSGIFPLIYIRMISTGEQTGNLDQLLADMGKLYEDEVNEATENLTKLMEPLILLIVGGLVGFLAVAVYLPIYNIGNVIT